VYANFRYDLWRNEILLNVSWTQTGGPEPAVELGKYITLWTDNGSVGKTYELGNGTRRVSAPWSWFDGEDHNLTVTGAVQVSFPAFGIEQTYHSGPDVESVSNFPRWIVVVIGLFILLSVIAMICVRAVRTRSEEET